MFKGKIHIAISKSGEPRDVQLTSDGAKLFDRLTKDKNPDALIFTHTATRHKQSEEGIEKLTFIDGWKHSDQKKLMQDACENAGIDPVVFYDFRHTYATMLFEAGCDLPTVAKQLGHASTRMLEKFYLKVREKHVAASINQAYPETGILDEPEGATILRFKPKTG
jgi:integrase